MSQVKRIEIIIKDEEAYNPETLRAIAQGNFFVEIVSPPPIPIKTRLRAFGAKIEGREEIVDYKPNPEPPSIYLTISEGERVEDTLFKTADSLMRYYAEKGSKEFVARFGSLEILKVCREVIKEGEGNPHPWSDSSCILFHE